MTSERRERVLVIKTSRFVDRAVQFATARWPDADVRMVAASTRINVVRLVTSGWGWRAFMWRPDAVVIQWWDRQGRGHEAADLAALLLNHRGFHVCLEDGSWQWVPGRQRLQRSVRLATPRLAGVAIVVAIAIANVCLWPVSAWHRRREQRRLAMDC